MMLTDRQDALLAFIRTYTERGGNRSPSFDEMKDFMGLQSKSGIFRLLKGLEERGFIARIHGRARAIEVLSRKPSDREQRLREAAHALVSRFGREASCGYVSHVPPELIQAIREALL